VRSVASFFVSRVDSLVDRRLEEMAAAEQDRADELRALRGKAAVANAKLAYQAFLETFSGPRWECLSAAGARVQRPLWASTSTKNPDYRDVMYVEELIGPDTVNTMPQSTLDAFRDHGEVRVTITEGVDDARVHLTSLEGVGITMDEVTARLEIEGVKAFADSFDSLVETLRVKRDGSRSAGA
jgi:transaldolase